MSFGKLVKIRNQKVFLLAQLARSFREAHLLGSAAFCTGLLVVGRCNLRL